MMMLKKETVASSLLASFSVEKGWELSILQSCFGLSLDLILSLMEIVVLFDCTVVPAIEKNHGRSKSMIFQSLDMLLID